MKGKRIITVLSIFGLCLALLLPTASPFAYREWSASAQGVSERMLVRVSMEKAGEALAAAEPIYEKLLAMVLEEIDEWDDGGDDFDFRAVEESLAELEADLLLVETLRSSLGELRGNMDSPDGKTILATREFLTMLINISMDMQELFEYSIELMRAILVVSDIGENFDSYSHFAEKMYEATGMAVAMMNNLTPPSYLKIAHEDMTLRFGELQDFSLDLYFAAELDDPLRLSSCFSRMNRIEAQMNRCAENLDGDLLLQFEQAARRLTGQVATLHRELKSNIALLLAA